jgi:hypothetical protein
LSLWGTFSYFPTSKPTSEFMKETEEVYLLTPSRWNPRRDAYTANEENMLDWKGNMIEKRDRSQILLSDMHEDNALAASVQISSIESNAINNLLQRSDADSEEKVQPCWRPIPWAADEASSVLARVLPLLDNQALYERLQARPDLGKFQASIGSTNASGSEFLVDNDSTTHDPTNSDTNEEDDKQALDDLFESIIKGNIDLDEVMLSAAHAGKSKGVDAAHLSKIWRIDLLKASERTLKITSQKSKRTDDPTLSQNYGSNDRMLRYKHIDECFFMDTFFATKKAGKSSRSNTCCQLFVTDMKSKIEVQAVKQQFAKEIRAPEAIICDMSCKQTPQSLQEFCNEIGTTLQVL